MKTLLLGAIAVAAISGPAAAQYDGGFDQRITLYEGPNFTGRSITLRGDVSNMSREFNDRAMSARVSGQWSLCADSDYRGRCVAVDRDVRDLRALGMGLAISSLRAQGGGGGYPGDGGYPPGGGGWPGGGQDITFFEGPNFTGRSVSFTGDISNMPRQHNDWAMSVRVRGSWRLCADSDYRGRCVDVDRDVRDLRSFGLARSISSARDQSGGGGGYPPPGGGGWGRARVTFFEGPNFTGRSFTADGNISNMPREFNDRAMSVRVIGYWRLCTDSDYRGRCEDVDRDVRDLRALGLERSISSAAIDP